MNKIEQSFGKSLRQYQKHNKKSKAFLVYLIQAIVLADLLFLLLLLTLLPPPTVTEERSFSFLEHQYSFKLLFEQCLGKKKHFFKWQIKRVDLKMFLLEKCFYLSNFTESIKIIDGCGKDFANFCRTVTALQNR